jgi:hypothetical protein
MTLILELPAEVEQVLAARAQARGVTVEKYLLDVATRETQEPEVLAEARQKRRVAALSGYGKFAGLGVTVDELLQVRHEEARREMERGR